MKNQIIWTPKKLRISVFPKDGKLDSASIWPKLKGLSIDKSVTDSKLGISVFEGTYIKNKLTLVVSSLKMDLVWEVLEPLNFTEKKISYNSLGELDMTIKNFEKLVKVWLSNKDLPPLARVAFGAILIKEVTDKKQGYKELLPLLPIKFKNNDCSDFSLQINIHTKSNVTKEIDINRLTRWMVMNTKSGILQLTQQTQTNKLNPDIYGLRLELDMSTQTNYQNVIKNTYQHFEELVKLGLEISMKGIE